MCFEEVINYIKSTLDYIDEDEFNKLQAVCKKVRVRLVTDFDENIVPKQQLAEIPVAYINKLYNTWLDNNKENSASKTANTAVAGSSVQTSVLAPITLNTLNYPATKPEEVARPDLSFYVLLFLAGVIYKNIKVLKE